MFQFENLRPDLIVADPNGELVDSDTPSTDWQFYYTITIMTKDMVISDFGEEILEYIKPDGKIFPTSEFLEIKEKDTDYYLLYSGQNKAREYDVSLLGSGMFPVRRYSKKKLSAKYKNIIEELKLDHLDEYIYKDSYKNPYLNLTQKYCYKKEDSPYNYGVQQKVYNIQVIQEYVENGKIDNFRKGLEEIIYATNIRPNQLDLAFETYKEKKLEDIRAILAMPPTYGQQPPSVGAIEFPQINPITAQQITQDIIRLARNTVGVDPDRLEVQKSEGLGVREMLQEEKSETVQDIVEDNLISIEKDVEKTINFVIVHKGLGLNNVMIQYEGVDKSPRGQVPFVRKKTISIVDAAKRLEGWNYQVIVSVDNIVKKSNAILVERIFSMIERLDPNAYPDLYKKVIIKLNEILQLNITSEDIVQQAPAQATGGASQFRTGAGAGNSAPNTDGGLQQQNPAIQAGSPTGGLAQLGAIGI
jgi:hypothetical protein